MREVQKAFLCEVYQRTSGDISKAVPYKEIIEALSFDKHTMAQACADLQGHKYILVFSSLRVDEIRRLIPVDDPPRYQLLSLPEKDISLTERGLSHVQRWYQC